MKLIITLCLFAVVAAQVQYPKASGDNVSLLRYDKEIKEDGSYKFNFALSDGQGREEQGQLTNAGLDTQSYSVKGSYYWLGPDNVEYTVTFVADENGYRPKIEKERGDGGAVSPQIASMLG